METRIRNIPLKLLSKLADFYHTSIDYLLSFKIAICLASFGKHFK